MPDSTMAAHKVQRAIRTLFAIQLISMGAMEMSGPFWPVHLRSLGASGLWFGFAGIAVYVGPMLGIMLTSAFWGRIGDRYGHKPMMVRALLGLAVTQLALAFSSDIATILLLRFLQGSCAGFIAPAQAYGVRIESPMRRARLFALLQVSTNVGSLLGAVLGGVILDTASFFWINALAALLCALCALAVMSLLPTVPTAQAVVPQAGVQQPHLASPWRSTPVLGLLCVMGILLIARMLTQTPFSLYVTSVFGAANSLVGLCYGVLALGFVASASAWARYFEGKALGEVLVRLTGIVSTCAALMLVAGLTRHIAVFAAMYLAWGVLLGATTPVLMALVSRAAASHQQGHVLGVAQSASQASSIAGIALGVGFSQVFGLESIYFFVALFYALAAAAILLLRRTCSPSPP